MISHMMEKYENDDEDEIVGQKVQPKDDMDIDQKHIMDDEKAEEDIQRDICLPSIKDSKLWRIKVTPGRERELVFKITNKLIEYLNAGDPLNVLEVFESSLCQGIIYCEAYKSQHVEKVLQGLSGINHRSVSMIPINEMTEVMKGCRVVQKQRFQVHQWVRVKGGIYKDDLGLIEMVDGNRRAMVRLIPRIPEDFYEDPTKNFMSLRSYNHSSPFIRIPPCLFNPLRVKNECQRELYRPLQKNFYIWRKMMFRNGFLYQEFKANKLITENVCPSLNEVKMFQIDPTT
jgi:transcription elongation factor SPT5